MNSKKIKAGWTFSPTITYGDLTDEADPNQHPYGWKPHVHKPEIRNGWNNQGPWEVVYGDHVVSLALTHWERLTFRLRKDKETWYPKPSHKLIKEALKEAVRLHDEAAKNILEETNLANEAFEKSIGIFRMYDEGQSEKWGSELMEESK